jgi:hypothetical protein
MKKLVLLSILVLFGCAKDDDEKIIISQNENIQYNLNVTQSANGRVSISGGSYSYESQNKLVYKGQNVTLNAWPDVGYKFESWSNGLTEEEILITLESDLTITANFVKIQTFNITVNEVEGGFIIIKNGNNNVSPGEFNEGTQLTIQAVINEGYIFGEWEGVESNSEEFDIILESNLDITLNLTALSFDINNMDIIKYHLYNNDTLSGKKINDLKNERFTWSGSHSFTDYEIENNLDFLVSENFIVWWDNRYNKSEMAVDILRWSEYSVVKLLEFGFDKPKDFDTHRINIFIRHEGNSFDVIPDDGSTINYVNKYHNRRKYISYPAREYGIVRNYPTPPVLHEMVHIFQSNTNKINFDYSWYKESTAEYIEQKLLLPLNGYDASLKFADYLYSTNLLFWDDVKISNDFNLYHKYGLGLFFLYLDSNGLLSPHTIADSFKIDSNFNIQDASTWNRESAFQYLKRIITNFEDVYFSFALKSSVIDFNYRQKIINALSARGTTLSNAGFKRMEIILENVGTSGFYNPSKEIYDWGFQTYLIKTTQNKTYSFELDSTFDNFKYGLVIEKGSTFEYYEIDSGTEFNLEANSNAYLIILNVSLNKEKRLWNNNYDLYEPYPYSIKISRL